MYRVRIMVAPEDAAGIESALELVESAATFWRDDDHGLAWVETFGAEETDALGEADRLLAKLRPIGIDLEMPLSAQQIEDRDWQEVWKEHFHVQLVSDHIMVGPSWEKCDPPPGVHVVRIDPGMSFGTGQHATTRACIQLLDALSASHGGSSFADVGCGSGILSIAASCLGFAVRDVFDNDPLAVQIARTNMGRNGVDSAPVRQADLAQWVPGATHDVVVANMLAVLLARFREAIVSLVAPGEDSRLVLGGMLEEQYAGIAHALATDGFVECRRIDLEGWSSGMFRRRAANS